MPNADHAGDAPASPAAARAEDPALRRRAAIVAFVLIVLSAALRLYRLDAPFSHHAPRQYDTAAMARNFHEGLLDIRYPQIDWRGDGPGFAEAEFQAYTFLVALLYRVFGVHEWLGGALNIVFYALTAGLLHGFARRLFGAPTALLATALYSVLPLSFFFTRDVQPDALLSLSSLAAVAFFGTWTTGGRIPAFLLSALAFALAVLIKPPSLYLFVPIGYLAWRRFGWGLPRRPLLWIYVAVVLVPAVLWYRHAYGLWVEYGNTFGILGIHTIVDFWSPSNPLWLDLAKEIARRLWLEIATPAGLPLLLAALFWVPPRGGWVFHWWLAGFLAYVVLVPRGHWGHDYYQLPSMFAVSVFMAAGTVTLWTRLPRGRLLWAGLLVGVVGLSAWQIQRMLAPRPAVAVGQAFGERLKVLTAPEDLVVFIASREVYRFPGNYRHRTAEGELLLCNPNDFYLSHRKGWCADEVQVKSGLLETLRRRGARFVASREPTLLRDDPELWAMLDATYLCLERTPEWAIYRLTPQAEAAVPPAPPKGR